MAGTDMKDLFVCGPTSEVPRRKDRVMAQVGQEMDNTGFFTDSEPPNSPPSDLGDWNFFDTDFSKP